MRKAFHRLIIKTPDHDRLVRGPKSLTRLDQVTYELRTHGEMKLPGDVIYEVKDVIPIPEACPILNGGGECWPCELAIWRRQEGQNIPTWGFTDAQIHAWCRRAFGEVKTAVSDEWSIPWHKQATYLGMDHLDFGRVMLKWGKGHLGSRLKLLEVPLAYKVWDPNWGIDLHEQETQIKRTVLNHFPHAFRGPGLERIEVPEDEISRFLRLLEVPWIVNPEWRLA